jgi:hypothetical protein
MSSRFFVVTSMQEVAIFLDTLRFSLVRLAVSLTEYIEDINLKSSSSVSYLYFT